MFSLSELLHTHWEAVLVMFATLVLVPKGLHILGLPQNYLYVLPAAGLCAAYLSFPHSWAGWLALPYLLLAAWLTVCEGLNLLVYKPFSLSEVLRVFVLAYWMTGAVWALCFLGQFQPLGFDPAMVGLTAAHFHVAGFVLGTVIYALLKLRSTPLSRSLGVAALLGMPSVALGITLTRWGYTPVIEGFSALLFAGMALSVAGIQIREARKNSLPRAARWCWLGGAGCLLAGAVLATLYALRFQWPLPWVNIPNMKVWHGTLNAVGFGWMSLYGWQLVNTSEANADAQISKL